MWCSKYYQSFYDFFCYYFCCCLKNCRPSYKKQEKVKDEDNNKGEITQDFILETLDLNSLSDFFNYDNLSAKMSTNNTVFNKFYEAKLEKNGYIVFTKIHENTGDRPIEQEGKAIVIYVSDSRANIPWLNIVADIDKILQSNEIKAGFWPCVRCKSDTNPSEKILTKIKEYKINGGSFLYATDDSKDESYFQQYVDKNLIQNWPFADTNFNSTILDPSCCASSHRPTQVLK